MAPTAVAAGRGVLAGMPAVLKVLWTIWLTAVSINVVVWALVSSTGGQLAYPWPLWVAGPYGEALFAVSAGVPRSAAAGAPPHGACRQIPGHQNHRCHWNLDPPGAVTVQGLRDTPGSSPASYEQNTQISKAASLPELDTTTGAERRFNARRSK